MNEVEEYEREEERYDAQDLDRDLKYEMFNSEVTNDDIKAEMLLQDLNLEDEEEYDEMKQAMFEQWLRDNE